MMTVTSSVIINIINNATLMNKRVVYGDYRNCHPLHHHQQHHK